MNELSVFRPYQRRRRFSREFKAQIVAQCLEPGVSISRISLDNGLNANMVRRWMREAQRHDQIPATPGFVPVNLPAATSLPGNQLASDKRNTIRIEIPRAGGPIVVEWPAELDPYAYLKDVLTRLPTQKNNAIDELLPHNWKPTIPDKV